ncbi:hypothetical protein [Acinetobacter sp.]|uniref:hypothetical protein n=1 Tax=Acinetobacter sp. TaxID=472 RepID=UPI000C09D3C3|nr:hypothetical protein [Acinetobacter sp.]MAK31984.1 hypothetical protein [Acinetobacter sp.]|tara:strand:+ start:1718 stop:2224 length:507 start_codon:yes stop_codon:yes gene_type:complete
MELIGKYECEITGTHLEPQGDRKGPQIVIAFRVLAKLHPDGTKEAIDGEINRRKWFTLTDKTAKRIAQDLAFLGFHGSPSQLDPSSENFVDISGAVGRWYVQQGTWNGNVREEWGVDRPKSAKSPQPFDPASRLEIDAKFDKYFQSEVESTVSPAVTNETAGGDDAPF